MSISRRSLISSSTTAATVAAVSTRRGNAQDATPSPVAGDPTREERVLAVMEEHNIPGAIVLHESPETGRWTAAFGIADLETGKPMTTDMHMRIGSITKTFTATMILQLVDQGVLSLEDTLAGVYPELADVQNADSMTIRHLLTMQSGLVDPEYPRAIEGDGSTMVPGPSYTPDEILGLVADQPAAFLPGEGGMYSNINYLLLGMVAEHLTGTPWRDMVRTGILDEVGLEQTSLPETSDLPAPSPRGYAYPQRDPREGSQASPVPPAGPEDVTELNPLISGPSGSMISTLGDLRIWLSHLWEGTLLSPEFQRTRLDFAGATDLQGFSYSFGLGAIDGLVGHTGNIDGFSSGMFYQPQRHTSVIALTNVYPASADADAAMLLIEAMLAE